MQLVPVQSSNIKAVGYKEGNLYIEFTSGVYVYTNVDKHIYEELLAAESKGKYVAANIRGNYSYRRVLTEELNNL